LDDHILALKDLESIIKIDPNNSQIKKKYEELLAFIESEKKGEKNIFKSFFRNINETACYIEAETKKDIQKSITNSIDRQVKDLGNIRNRKITDDDNNIGKPEIRILNL